MPHIVLIEQWGANSWKVATDVPYANPSRPPHVEVGPNTLVHAGQRYELTQLHVYGQAVMWQVVGLTNFVKGRHPAHFTVYYGPHAQGMVPWLRAVGPLDGLVMDV